ncbi:hypothetical protein BJY04DRAFT_221279 [Aspergillus karnatakaensis]|uniref:uncharacterized protein n=1 Tax=Aspergillus karnatakaensis TaxID=1810916 RepID=UPI003CCD4156
MTMTTTMPPATSDETMRLAISTFRTRMAAANKTFLQDRINEITARDLPTEQARRDKLWQYRWMPCLGWWDDPPDRNTDVVVPKDTRFADLDASLVLKILPRYSPADGVLPSMLRTEEWREMYIDTVQRICQAQADKIAAEFDDDDEERLVIPRCDELALFVKYAGGVVDADFRDSGIAGFEPAYLVGVREEELAGLDEDQRREKLADPALFEREKERLDELLNLDSEFEKMRVFIDEDLDVRAGFLTGTGYNRWLEYRMWYSAYVYCRLWTDEEEGEGKGYGNDEIEVEKEAPVQDADNIKEWGWRVVVFQAEGENPSVLYGRRPRFDTIPEFLEWYASWPDYMDARTLLSLRRRCVNCETDCESDCEDHS